MKIYQGGSLGDLPLDKIGIGILVIIVAGILVMSIQGTVYAPLSATLIQNPVSLSKNESTVLHVGLTNPSANPQTNVIVSTQTLGTTQLSIYPQKQTVSTLGPQETRELDFLIVPIDAESKPFLPGNYRIDIQTEIEGKKYPVSVFLTVTK